MIFVPQKVAICLFTFALSPPLLHFLISCSTFTFSFFGFLVFLLKNKLNCKLKVLPYGLLLAPLQFVGFLSRFIWKLIKCMQSA